MFQSLLLTSLQLPKLKAQTERSLTKKSLSIQSRLYIPPLPGKFVIPYNAAKETFIMAKLAERALKYETWFDRRRVELAKISVPGSPMSSLLRDILRAQLISFAYTKLFPKEKSEIARHAMKKSYSDFTVQLAQKYNRRLPIPLPDTGDPINDAIKIILSKDSQFLMTPDLSGEDLQTQTQLIDMMHSLLTHCGEYLLHHENTELMMIDSDLLEAVLKSCNETITADDLNYVPFDKMILEFHRPIQLFNKQPEIKATAVGFYKQVNEDGLGIYTAIWYCGDLRSPERKEIPIAVDAKVAIGFCNNGFHQITYDTPIQDIFHMNLDEGVFDIDILSALNEEIKIKTRNIWDFLTSRNIQYQESTRQTPPWSKIKKYKHNPELAKLGPRLFKIIKVNKTITEPLEGEGTYPSFSHSVKIPARFHKWVYCKTCTAVHRNDLIGMPCRKCGKQVGPILNLVIKKHWHQAYIFGAGPLKETVYEVRD